MKKYISLLLMLLLAVSMIEPCFAGWQDELYSEPAIIDRSRPSYLDLDEIQAFVDYPDKNDYLSSFETKYIRASKGHSSVYALHGLVDGSEWKNLAREIFNDTKVVVLAEKSFTSEGRRQTYCCCIYEDDGKTYAGWIHKNFLADERTVPEARFINRDHPSYLDLDDINAFVDYPNQSEYLKDYEVMYVQASKGHSSVYALHGLVDGSEWKNLAREIFNDTKVIVLAERTITSEGKKQTYCCCMYEDDGCYYAGWINKAFLKNTL